MKNTDYTRIFIEKLSEFRKPGQALCIDGRYKSGPSRQVKCALCGWPDTSQIANSSGLTNIYLLRNLSTRKEILVGSECILTCQKYLEQNEKNSRIQNIDLLYSVVEEEVPDFIDERTLEKIELAIELSSDETYHYYFSEDDFEDM